MSPVLLDGAHVLRFTCQKPKPRFVWVDPEADGKGGGGGSVGRPTPKPVWSPPSAEPKGVSTPTPVPPDAEAVGSGGAGSGGGGGSVGSPTPKPVESPPSAEPKGVSTPTPVPPDAEAEAAGGAGSGGGGGSGGPLTSNPKGTVERHATVSAADSHLDAAGVRRLAALVLDAADELESVGNQ